MESKSLLASLAERREPVDSAARCSRIQAPDKLVNAQLLEDLGAVLQLAVGPLSELRNGERLRKSKEHSLASVSL